VTLCLREALELLKPLETECIWCGVALHSPREQAKARRSRGRGILRSKAALGLGERLPLAGALARHACAQVRCLLNKQAEKTTRNRFWGTRFLHTPKKAEIRNNVFLLGI